VTASILARLYFTFGYSFFWIPIPPVLAEMFGAAGVSSGPLLMWLTIWLEFFVALLILFAVVRWGVRSFSN
jgi:uncharacterized membrane protein YphA (DoxX/SURF4 family)